MISKKNLRELIKQRIKDADILITNRRYVSGLYMAGYALELALKLKICKIYRFSAGFPENKSEFTFYQLDAKSQPLLLGTINQIKDIKNHDLNKLLYFSGVEYQVKLYFLPEWNLAVSWKPEMRYQLQKILKNDAVNKIIAIKTIIQNIL